MHIQDGFLPPETIALGIGCAGVLTAVTLPRLAAASPPRTAMVTSAFFVGTLLAFPFYGTSLHLSLVSVCGVILGAAAFPAILVGLTLQFALLGHGGLTTLGVNATTMGIGALVAAGVFRSGPPSPRRGAFAGLLGTLAALTLYGAALLTAGDALQNVVKVVLVVHAPLLLIEAAITASVVKFLLRVQPDLLRAPVAQEAV